MSAGQRWVSIMAAVGGLAVFACGGTVVVPDEEDGGSGGGAGSGGGVAGSGGGVAGSGGTTTVDACSPLPLCNWCDGETVYDASGCPVGYVCANGVDPCTTDPCFGKQDCAPNEICKDMLCWPNTVSCDERACGVGMGPGGAETCDCMWSCDDGNDYAFECEATVGSTSCECMINGNTVFGCGSGVAGSGGGGPLPDPCVAGECCGFPE